jgi:hypothetical protein
MMKKHGIVITVSNSIIEYATGTGARTRMRQWRALTMGQRAPLRLPQRWEKPTASRCASRGDGCGAARTEKQIERKHEGERVVVGERDRLRHCVDDVGAMGSQSECLQRTRSDAVRNDGLARTSRQMTLQEKSYGSRRRTLA